MVLDYIDPGYGNKMLNSDGTALADNITIVENDTYNPFGGVAFTCTNGNAMLPVSMVIMPTTSGIFNTMSLKFSVYCGKNIDVANSLVAGFYGAYTSNNTIYPLWGSVHINDNNFYMDVFRGASNVLIGDVDEGFHNITVSITQGRRDTMNEITTTVHVDNIGKSATFSSHVNNPWYIPARCYINLPSSDHYVSNVIYGRGGILSPQLQVVKLPISKALLDGMKLSEDKSHYIATSVDQSCLLTIDTAELAKTYDTNLPVSHIVVGGYPCYAQNGAANITGISKENGEVTTHGSCSVSNDSLGAASTFWALEDKKISDLANIQVGWKAGA